MNPFLTYPVFLDDRAKNKGFLIIGAAVTVMVTAALMALAADRMMQDRRIERAQQIGHSLAILGDGLESYIDRYYEEISKGKPIGAIRNARTISVSGLIELMKLKGISTQVPNMPQAQFGISIEVPITSSNGLECDSGNNRFREATCRVVGLAYINRPLMRNESVDALATARAVRSVGKYGGYAPTGAPNTMRFLSANSINTSVQTRNPVPGQAGIIARLVDPIAQSGSVSEFLRVDGGNTMLATLNMQSSLNGVNHDVTGVGKLNATGNIQTTNGYIWAGSEYAPDNNGAWLSPDGEIISAKGNVIARDGYFWAQRNDIKANRFLFNRKRRTSREGASVILDEECGDAFAIAPGPAPYDKEVRGKSAPELAQEYLYICTHDVYFSGPELRVHQGVIAGLGSWNNRSDGYAPQNTFPVNFQNPGYYRSPKRIWRPIDQKQAVTQRFMLTDEGVRTVELGYWQICADSTGLFTQYNATGGGHFMPIVRMLWQDRSTGKWMAEYERFTHYQRDQGFWGKIVCNGKL